MSCTPEEQARCQRPDRLGFGVLGVFRADRSPDPFRACRKVDAMLTRGDTHCADLT